MESRIEPALSAKEWADPPDTYGLCVEWDGHEAKIIALANDTLSDSDPRKITREKVERIRHLAELAWLREMSFKIAEPFARQNADRAKAEVLGFADALESYLPPGR